MRDKRIMNYLGRVIWMSEYGFMLAKGDGTDEYFSTIEEAMIYIEDEKCRKTEATVNKFMAM